MDYKRTRIKVDLNRSSRSRRSTDAQDPRPQQNRMSCRTGVSPRTCTHEAAAAERYCCNEGRTRCERFLRVRSWENRLIGSRVCQHTAGHRESTAKVESDRTSDHAAGRE